MKLQTQQHYSQSVCVLIFIKGGPNRLDDKGRFLEKHAHAHTTPPTHVIIKTLEVYMVGLTRLNVLTLHHLLCGWCLSQSQQYWCSHSADPAPLYFFWQVTQALCTEATTQPLALTPLPLQHLPSQPLVLPSQFLILPPQPLPLLAPSPSSLAPSPSPWCPSTQPPSHDSQISISEKISNMQNVHLAYQVTISNYQIAYTQGEGARDCF